MSGEVYSTRRARADLSDIWLTIAIDNIAAADRLLDRIEETCRKLAENKLLGRARPELGENVRSLPIGAYVLFYVPVSDGIELIRILHGARDIPARFKE